MLTQLAAGKENTLLLDAGALLFDKSTITPGRQLDQAKINAAGLAEAYNLLGYEAVGVSTFDLAGGVDFLEELGKKSQFSWLSANLVDPKSRRPLFTPFIVKEKAGLRIAIIGLTGSGQTNAPLMTQENYLILPWQDALSTVMQKIDDQADLIILLSSLPPQENEQISKKFTNIHLIIQAGTSSHNPSPALISNTLIAQTGKQGKYLGQMLINWSSSGKWTDTAQDPLLLRKQEYDRLSWQVKRLETKGDPKTVYKDDSAALTAYYNLVDRMQTLEKEIHDLQSGNDETAANSTFENTFLEIEPTIADDPAVEKIIQETRMAINALGRRANDVSVLADYAGSESCMACHAEIGRRWLLTPHARAYETLVGKNQQFNINCVPCHVTGVSMLDQDRSRALSLPASLHQVGCETCHGPGAEHIKNPEKIKLAKSPAAALCLQCHSSEHDDGFQFEQDSKLVH